jgi:hypothetical protein
MKSEVKKPSIKDLSVKTPATVKGGRTQEHSLKQRP